MAGIFKAYDVRGLYGSEIDEATARDVAHALVKFTRCKTVVIGHDMRDCAPSMHKALMDGLVEAGCHVTSIGLCTSPMLYYAIGKHQFDAGVMVTASHNPKEYIGLKLCREKAIPIGGNSGMDQIEILATSQVRVRSPPGKVHLMDITQEYMHFIKGLLERETQGLNVVVDCGNGMGALDLECMKHICGDKIHWHGLYTELDGSFPNHQPNPLDHTCMQDLIQEVQKQEADIGLAFDGDSDRIGFVDETGRIVEGDLITGLLAVDTLQKNPGAHILSDVRSSNCVPEHVKENGGTISMTPVGHALIKKQMRDEDALFGGELACHFYYKDCFYTDNAILTALKVLGIVAQEGKPFSEIIKPFRRYLATGEINNRVKDADAILKTIEEQFGSRGKVTRIDGVRIDCEDYWFCVRKSNTEPIIRYTGEAKDQSVLDKITAEVLDVIGGERV